MYKQRNRPRLVELSDEQIKAIACPRCGANPGEECRYGATAEPCEKIHYDRKSEYGPADALE